ncbi:MAG: hypothetical protein K0R51_753 [Cytophagaceae bacterium]|jgi:hypothetical protein|nr:hypothetical protein [Cytophagaceae bacterium]
MHSTVPARSAPLKPDNAISYGTYKTEPFNASANDIFNYYLD